MARGSIELRQLLFGETGGANHMDDTGLRRERGKRHRGLGHGEIEHAFHMSKQRMGVVGHCHAQWLKAGHFAQVQPDGGRSFCLEAASGFAARGLMERPGQRLAHAPGGTQNGDPHVTHGPWLPHALVTAPQSNDAAIKFFASF